MRALAQFVADHSDDIVFLIMDQGGQLTESDRNQLHMAFSCFFSQGQKADLYSKLEYIHQHVTNLQRDQWNAGVDGETDLTEPVKPLLHDALNVTDDRSPLQHSKHLLTQLQ